MTIIATRTKMMIPSTSTSEAMNGVELVAGSSPTRFRDDGEHGADGAAAHDDADERERHREREVPVLIGVHQHAEEGRPRRGRTEHEAHQHLADEDAVPVAHLDLAERHAADDERRRLEPELPPAEMRKAARSRPRRGSRRRQGRSAARSG